MVVFQKKCKIKEMKQKKIRFGLLLIAILIAIGLKIWISRVKPPVEEYVPRLTPSLLPSSSQPPQKLKVSKLQRSVARSNETSDIDEFLNHYDRGRWKLQKDEEGRVRSILGGIIPGAGKNLESALKLAHSLSPFFGVPVDQLLSSKVKVVEGPRTTSYDFQQTFQGYPVFRGRMIIISRNQDGAVYLINNDLRQVDPIQIERTHSSQESLRILEERYAKRESREIYLDSPDLVVWADGWPHELAWSFIVEFSGENPGRLRLLVGMQSSKVLLEQNLVMHQKNELGSKSSTSEFRNKILPVF